MDPDHIILPIYIANSFIREFNSRKIKLSPMKLQRLLYLTFARFLQERQDVLFAEHFVVWAYGPVIESVYAGTHHYGDKNIGQSIFYSNGITYIAEEDPFCNLLKQIIADFGQCSAKELSELVRQPGTAWYKAFQREERFLMLEEIATDPCVSGRLE